MQRNPQNDTQGHRCDLLYIDLVNDALDVNTFSEMTAVATPFNKLLKKITSNHRSMTAGADLFLRLFDSTQRWSDRKLAMG
jgi:hypothetical protein